MRFRSVLLLLTVLAGLGPLAGFERLAHAESESPAVDDKLAVGTQLVALDDVNLRNASLSKGARVNVTKVVVDGGRIATVDVELADGHVLRRVAIDTIRKAFTVATD